MENFKIDHNVETNEIAEIELTEAEIAQKAKDAAEAQSITEARNQAQTAKEAAQAKLAALGLTTDDLKALGL
jgi:hypothetical protein